MESNEGAEDGALAESDVTRADKLDDRVQEGDGLPGDGDDGAEDDAGE